MSGFLDVNTAVDDDTDDSGNTDRTSNADLSGGIRIGTERFLYTRAADGSVYAQSEEGGDDLIAEITDKMLIRRIAKRIKNKEQNEWFWLTGNKIGGFKVYGHDSRPT